jgi:hypothetical protein
MGTFWAAFLQHPEIQLLVFSINLSLFKNLNPKVDFVEQLRGLNVEKSFLSPPLLPRHPTKPSTLTAEAL